MKRARALPLFKGLAGVTRAAALRDAIGGFTLAAMSVPQVLGYTRIAGTPVVTGLYTLLLPLVAFAALGSSRYLVVAADSATAAILAGGLSSMAAAGSDQYMVLAGVVALLTAGFLLLARLLKLGFLADFLSQTVLVGFLTGVGVQVGIAVLGEMLGVPIDSPHTAVQVLELVRGLRQAHVLTFGLSLAVVALVVPARSLAPRIPVPLLAVIAAIAVSATFDVSAHGVAVLGPLPGGLPHLVFPHTSVTEALAVLPIAASCFVIVVAQSAATARAYAVRHGDVLDEDTDLFGLAAANAAAALSGAFVVNGSPTQTAMVERAGARSQLAHLITAALVALVLLAFTGPLQYLPRCVLAAIVFTIAVGLVDVSGLRAIRRESAGEFRLAIITAAVVVLIGVGQGILLAMVLSLFRHVRHSYRPHTGVLIADRGGLWRATAAVPGAVTEPGLVIYRFGADLFYANAQRFAAEIRALVEGAPTPVRWLVVDAGAITSIDYTAAAAVRALQGDLARRSVALLLVHVGSSLQADLDRHRLTDVIGPARLFDSLHEALAAIRGERPHRSDAE